MFPAWLQALVLGIVQGLTEFIPVSSSGHLVLVPYLLGFEDRSLAFDVMLHLGTLFAVLLYFRGEIMAIVRGLLRLDTSEQGLIYRRVGLFVLPASIPIGLVGFLLAEQVEDLFASPLAASSFLLLTAVLLITMERVRGRRVSTSPASEGQPVGASAGMTPRAAGAAWDGDWRPDAKGPTDHTPVDAVSLPLGVDLDDPSGRTLADLTLRDAMFAGFLQCLAVLPGVSRSGSTITGGVFAGLTREAATRFSFLLAIPALVGATALSIPDLFEPGAESTLELGVGILAAFISGYAAVRYLVALVSREKLTGFAYYCVAASAVGFVGYLMLGPASSI